MVSVGFSPPAIPPRQCDIAPVSLATLIPLTNFRHLGIREFDILTFTRLKGSVPLLRFAAQALVESPGNNGSSQAASAIVAF